MEITASILDYLGKYKNGIFVLVGLMYKEKFYKSYFYYTDNEMVITVEKKLTKELGCEIEEYEYYLELLEKIINMCEPFENIFDQLEPVKW